MANIDTWKVNIKGNSMDGVFPDGQSLLAKVWTDFDAGCDLQIGRIVIFKKKKPFSSCKFASSDHRFSPSEAAQQHVLIIHRIVARFFLKGQLSFWEKGDNDYFPKVCYPEEIVGIVMDIEGHPEIFQRLQPGPWQRRNRKLLRFYKTVGMIYTFIEEGRDNQRLELIYKIGHRGFWCILYFLCSFLNLKGH
ncbi:MAG: hypothetical protein AB1847_13740 [bacterium]